MSSCRIITSPTTGEPVQSKTWLDIRSKVDSDRRADEVYDKLTSPGFIATYGDWVSNPSNFKGRLNDQGEPFASDYSEIFRANNKIGADDKQLISKLNKTNEEIVNKPTSATDNAYFIGAVQIKDRVTRWIKSQMGNLFKDRDVSEKQKNMEDQFKEWGSRGHRDMQKLINRYLDKDGKTSRDKNNVVVIQDNTPFQSEIDPNNKGIFKQMDEYVKDLLSSYDPETVFRTEQTIYNARGGKTGERDIAGTMDFMAIQPDGKKDILDWKFARINKNMYDDIAWFKQNEWNLQMQEYKKILKNEYGLKDTDFGKTRMIPFILEYTGKNIDDKIVYYPSKLEVASTNLKIDEKTYLLPVATPDESTGNEQLDKLIRSLTSLYNTIKDIPAPDKQRNIKNEQLNKIFAAIRHLQVNKNFEPLTEQIGVLIKETERIINNHNQKFSNLENLSEKDISDEASNLLLKAQALHLYKDLDTIFNDFYGDSPSQQELEILKKLHETVGRARFAYSNVEALVKKFGDRYIASRRGVEDLLKPEKTVTGLTKWFSTTSQLPPAAMKTLFLMIDNANNRIQVDLNDAKDELVKLKKEVDKWGGTKKALEFIKKKPAPRKEKETDSEYKNRITRESNKLIDQYQREFYDGLKNAVEKKDTQWVKDNIDQAAFEKYLKDTYQDKKEVIESTVWSSDSEKDTKIKKERLDELNRQSDPTNKESYLQYFNLRSFPSSKWETKEYQTLKANKPVFDFYHFIRQWNQKAHDLGYLSPSQAERNFLPYLYKSFTEKIGMGGEYSFSDWLVSSLTIDQNVAGYGNYNPLTGQIEDSIPTYFTREIENPAQISEDLFINMAAYIKAVINYEQKQAIDGQVRALYFVEQNKESLQVNQFGSLVKVNGQPVTVDTNDKNAELLMNHIKSLQYGQKYSNTESTDALLGDWVKGYNNFIDRANKVLGFNILPKANSKLEGKQISATRLMDATNRFFSVKNMGLNLATSASVYFGGNFQAVINSGKYYTKGEFLASEFQHAGHKYFGDVKKHLALIKAFMPIDERLQREINKLSATKLTGANMSDFLMVMMRESDHLVQYANFLSFMKNTIIVDGKLYNAREYYRNSSEYANRYNLSQQDRSQLEKGFEEKVQKLLADNSITKLSTVDKNGNLQVQGIKDLKNDNTFKYRTLIREVARRATGNISPENEMLIRMNAIFRSMLVFKNWIPGLVKQRFGGLSQDVATGDWQYGRVRMLIKHLGPLALLKIGNIKDIIQGNEKGVSLVKQYYQKQKSAYENATNKDLDLNEAEFADMFRKSLRNQIKEVMILTSMMGIYLAALTAFKPDDDEEMELKNKYKFMVRITDKVKDELSFYYDPRGIQQILNGSIFPALGVFSDATNLITTMMTEIYGISTGNEGLTEKTHAIKTVMKSLPLTREAIYYIAMFDSDLAKELGIQMSSQSRMK